jgi:hypothetical protein
LSWAAVWLYVIDGDQDYLTDINEYLSHPTRNGDKPLVQNHWTMCWDDMGLAVLTKLSLLTNNSQYRGIVEENLDYWLNNLTTSPGGMKYLHNWGVLRYNASASMIALLYYGDTGNSMYYNFSQKQIDYILGDNPANRSYMIGYGSNWPTHPHHRAANGYTYANGDNAKEAQHTLTGALVGGPDQSDNYIDDVNQYQYTEVAIDYNAGLVGALAGIIKYNGGDIPPTEPVATDPPQPTDPPDNLGDVNNDGQITIVDALMTAQYYVGLNPAGFNAANANVNCDSSISIIDALIIAQYYVGLIHNFC